MTDLKVTQFDALKTYPDTVRVLEDLLERAKSGNVLGVAAIILLKERCFGSVYTEGVSDHCVLGIGALEELKYRLLLKIEE